MKKSLTVVAMLMAICLTFTACGQDPVAKELQEFANEEMKEVNEKYDKFVADNNEITSHQSSPDDYKDYVNNTLIKELDEIISEVEGIETEHDEVTDLKDKYLKVMNGYHSVLEKCVEAVENEDTEGLTKAGQELQDVNKDLNTYNETLRKLGDKYELKVIE